MGFPVGYTEVFLPKIFVQTISFLGFFRSLVVSLFNVLGLSHFIHLDEDNIWKDYPSSPQPRILIHHRCHHVQNLLPSAALIREFLPLVNFKDLGEDLSESCAVCLYEFKGGDEVKWLERCQHIFHRACLDHWIDHERFTCPLCRTSLVSVELDQHIE